MKASVMRSREAGVAIITALVVVAAATVAVSTMMWRQSIAVRKVENQDALAQTRWLARSALEWARLILQQDARLSAVDHLGEIWAVPLAETRVTEDFAPTDPSRGSANTASIFAENDAAYVSGRIVDAQSHFNLTGMAIAGKVDEARFAILARLIDVLGLRSELAKTIAARMAGPSAPESFELLGRDLVASGALDAAGVARLRPYIDILPVPTAVNLNTATPEVISACYEDLPIDAARALVRTRDQAWFTQVGDVAARLPGTSGKVAASQVGVNSAWFEVEGRVRVGRAELEVAGLIEREANGTTRVRSFREL